MEIMFKASCVFQTIIIDNDDVDDDVKRDVHSFSLQQLLQVIALNVMVVSFN